jgi:hypothetical protein
MGVSFSGLNSAHDGRRSISFVSSGSSYGRTLIELCRSDRSDTEDEPDAAVVAISKFDDDDASDGMENESKVPDPSMLSRVADDGTSLDDGRCVLTGFGMGSGSVKGVSLSLQTCEYAQQMPTIDCGRGFQISARHGKQICHY